MTFAGLWPPQTLKWLRRLLPREPNLDRHVVLRIHDPEVSHQSSSRPKLFVIYPKSIQAFSSATLRPDSIAASAVRLALGVRLIRDFLRNFHHSDGSLHNSERKPLAFAGDTSGSRPPRRREDIYTERDRIGARRCEADHRDRRRRRSSTVTARRTGRWGSRKGLSATERTHCRRRCAARGGRRLKCVASQRGHPD